MKPPLREWIGPYRVEAILGIGGMGVVYRAYDDRLDRRVAIKLIKPEIALHEEARKRFLREARAAACLDHPAIVRIHHVLELEERDAIAIVMEFVEGLTLANLLRDGALELGRALPLALRIAEGLAVAHAKGIVHRDLKTENVMVTPADEVKILDFGLAKLFRKGEVEKSLTIGVVGTPRAMSPEQVREERVDHRSDLFSFGTLLYEMLTGQNPFMAEAAHEIMTKVCTLRQPPVRQLNPEVPEPLSDLVDRLLEKDPKCRPRDAQEVVTALKKIAAGETPSSPAPSLDPTLEDNPGPPKPSPMPWLKILRRWAMPLAAVVGLVIGFGDHLIEFFTPRKDQMAGPEVRHSSDPLPQELSDQELFDLVEKKKQLGHLDAARDFLKNFVNQFPDNRFARSLQAELELGYGNPGDAAILYANIPSPDFEELNNLGTAYLIARRYTEAKETFLQALKLSPEDPAVVLSLADAVSLLGHDVNEAPRLYNRVLKLTDKSANTEDPKFLTIRAQALAHLGREVEAKIAVQEALTLPAAQSHPEVWYEASLIFTLAGDHKRAYLYAEKALEKRIAPGWFHFSWFDPLKTAKPEFVELLKQHGGSGS